MIQRNMKQKRDENSRITNNVINLMVAIGAGISLIMWILVSMIIPNIIIGFGVALILGFGLWSAILFNSTLFDMFFVIVEVNYGLVLVNQNVDDLISDNVNERTKMTEAKGVREIYHGWHGKMPWERISNSVNMKSEILIGSPLTCYSKDNIEMVIDWQVVLTPLRGYIHNLVRKNQSAMVSFFEGTFEQKIINWVSTKDAEDVLSNMKDLSSAFADTFGGPDMVSQTEIDYGMFTNLPQITGIKRSAKYQESAEGLKIGSNVSAIIKQVKENLGEGADQNLVLATATALAGKEIKGLLLIPGYTDGKALTGLLAGASDHGVKATGSTNSK